MGPFWIVLAGCAGPTGDDPPDRDPTDGAATDHTGPVTDGHTGGSSGGAHSAPDTAISATCALQPDNSLRVDCEVTVDPPQAVEVRYRRADGAGRERVRRSDAPADRHDLTLWYLSPDADHEIEVHPADGGAPFVTVVRTGALPAVADVVVQTEGTSSAALFGSTSPCPGGAGIVWDPATREVVWYQPFGGGPGGFLEGVSFSDEGTVLGLSAGAVTEVDLAGDRVRLLRQGLELPLRAHHDVFRRAGLTYVLFQEVLPPDDVWIDGFYVFDAGGLLWEWHLADVVPPPQPQGRFGTDWSHANAVWADASGDVYVSFRHLSAVVKVEGDPADPAFGEIRWRLAGTADSPLGTDLSLDTGAGLPGFEQQHNAHVLDDGTLTLFDNRQGLERSRILDLAVDEAAGTATAVRWWDVPGELSGPGHCDFQGSAWRTAAGNPVATCAPFRTGTEYDAVTGEVVWTGTLTCATGSGTYVPRFVPLEE